MKTKLISCALAGVVLTSCAGCGSKSRETSQAEDIKVTNITVATAGNQSIVNTIVNTGEVTPSQEVIVSPKVSGKVKTLHAQVGQYVRAGETLFSIDDTDYRLQYNQAMASYNSAQASYASTVGGTQKQSVSQVQQSLTAAQSEYDSALLNYNREKELYENNSNVVLAQNALDEARSARDRAYSLYEQDVSLISVRNALENAKDAYDRTQRLFDLGAASQMDLDTARIAYENAQANLTAQESSAKANLEAADSAVLQAEENLRTTTVNAAASYDAAQTRLTNAQANLKSAKENYDLTVNVLNPERQATAEASVKSAKAALDIAKNTLDNAAVKAPVSGYVTQCSAVAGQNIQAGSSAVTLIDSNSMDIVLHVTEASVSKIQPGAEAIIQVPSANIEGMSGSVASVSPSKDNTSGLFSVKINVPNPDGALKGGMFADVEIVTQRIDDVLAVPTDTVLNQDNEAYVYVVDGETAVKTQVVTGSTDEQYTEILSGLAAGQQVVQKGKDFLKEDQCAVKVVAE